MLIPYTHVPFKKNVQIFTLEQMLPNALRMEEYLNVL